MFVWKNHNPHYCICFLKGRTHLRLHLFLIQMKEENEKTRSYQSTRQIRILCSVCFRQMGFSLSPFLAVKLKMASQLLSLFLSVLNHAHSPEKKYPKPHVQPCFPELRIYPTFYRIMSLVIELYLKSLDPPMIFIQSSMIYIVLIIST